jgi:hypothetical protein
MDSMLSSTLPKAEGSARSQPARGGGDGVLIWQSANGGPFAKTTAATGKLGHSSRSSMRTAAPIVGERTASRVSATTLCAGAFGLALWNGKDAILKERLFGLGVLFYEYFNGDDGRGLGASHQTGWTALIANLLVPKEIGVGG